MSDVVKRARATLTTRGCKSQMRRVTIQLGGDPCAIEDPIVLPAGLVADLCDAVDKLRTDRRRLRKRVAILRGLLPAAEDYRSTT